MKRRITPSQKAKVIALLEAGYSKSASASEVGISLSTVKRIANNPAIKKGKNHEKLVEAARESLHSALSSDFAKEQLAALVVDDLAIAARLRDNVTSLLEHIDEMDVTNLKDAGAKARTLAAIATANKLNTDNLRHVIALAAPQIEVEELPELIVTEMLIEDIAAIRNDQRENAEAMGIIITDEGTKKAT